MQKEVRKKKSSKGKNEEKVDKFLAAIKVLSPLSNQLDLANFGTKKH